MDWARHLSSLLLLSSISTGEFVKFERCCEPGFILKGATTTSCTDGCFRDLIGRQRDNFEFVCSPRENPDPVVDPFFDGKSVITKGEDGLANRMMEISVASDVANLPTCKWGMRVEFIPLGDAKGKGVFGD